MSSNTRFEVVDQHEIKAVWAGQASGFDLYTRGDHQFVAFYAADQSITVGQRQLDSTEWTLACVSEDRNDVWDPHNDLVMAVDDDGFVHVAGDMHSDPLKYYRTTEPLDVTTFERIDQMAGNREDHVTYPRFFRGPDGELLFEYRDGYSGAGDWMYNVYDTSTQKWSRLLDEPLLYFGKRASAYKQGPTIGPDGYYHLVWCLRDNGAAQTNHDLYYARSKDLQNWENSRGDEISIPIGYHFGELIDPVPSHGGLANSQIYLGFDTQQRLIVSYFKYDGNGDTQIYNARNEANSLDKPIGWEIYKTSDWDYKYRFGGIGSIDGEGLQISGVETEPDGQLSQTYSHPKYGTGRWILDEETLEPTEWYSPWSRYPSSLQSVDSDRPEMQVVWDEDIGESSEETRYVLRWEADAGNAVWADSDTEAPDPSTLRLYEFTPAQ